MGKEQKSNREAKKPKKPAPPKPLAGGNNVYKPKPNTGK